MKKNNYRATSVEKLNFEKLSKDVCGKNVVLGIDVAKVKQFACIMDEKGEVIKTIKWNHPDQSVEFKDLIKRLPLGKIEVAMEPSGSYGDPIKQLFSDEQIEVYRVSPKRSHDAAEVYDGVPSWHDAKSAAIIGKLHLDGASEKWELKDEQERDLDAVIKTVDMCQRRFNQDMNRVEAQMARYWPAINKVIDMQTKTFLKLLDEFGSPAQVAGNSEKAIKLMRYTGGHFLKDEKIRMVIESAESTIGVAMTEYEQLELNFLVKNTLAVQDELKEAKKRLKKLSSKNETIKRLGAVVGITTSAILISECGDPLKYDYSKQWLKSFGLNLKEKSSGNYTGQLRITKRGSGRARHWLYFAALRLIQNDAPTKIWYDKKVKRDGGLRMKGIVAVMRKLVKALWHVARDGDFDSSKMFDMKGLQSC
ncbi:MAG: IS110 family transposase [Chloroflexi bacterium]|nr:IS110 family transposase [Chloroflexota bacterium]